MAANKLSGSDATVKKHPGGRPKKFTEKEQLQNKIQHYFDSITRTVPAFDMEFDHLDDDNKEVFKRVPRLNNAGEQVFNTEYFERPSVLGLCAHIGITRETLLQYEKDEKYSDTIKMAKSRIEQYLEEQLFRKDQVTGIIFNLKNNFGWKDKTEQEITGKDGGPIQHEDVSLEEKLKFIEGLKNT
jgi:DNA-binding XRE family transcriptional regulator